MTSVQSIPTLRVGVKLEDFDENEETESWPFRELVGGLLWLTTSIRPDISNAVPSVARYCSAPKAIHWKSALDILAYINCTCGFGITYHRGSTVSNTLDVVPDAGYASKATKRRYVCVRRCNYVCSCMCVLGFQDAEICHPLYF